MTPTEEGFKACPECTKKVELKARVCPSCGFRFDRVAPTGPSLPPPVGPAADNPEFPEGAPEHPSLFGQITGSLKRNWSDFRRQAFPEAGFVYQNRVTVGILAAVLAGLLIAFAVLSGDDPKRVRVLPGALKASLAVGGENSSTVPKGIAIDSLTEKKPQGYELIITALRRRTIAEFRETKPTRKWKSRFVIDGGPKKILFAKDRMIISDSLRRREQSDAISRLGVSIYGFEAYEGYDDLESRLTSLLDLVSSTTLYEGESAPEISSTAYALAADLREWLEESKEFVLPETRLLINSEINLAESAGRLGDAITQDNLDAYNSAISASNFASQQRAKWKP
jgi:hypothetical protein